MAFRLKEQQKEKIAKFLSVFEDYKKTEQYKLGMEDRVLKLKFFRLITKKLNSLDESDIGVIISSLWATEFWSNQQYVIDKVINNNGLDKLRKSFVNLFDSSQQIEKRYEDFLKNIKGLGPASVTEILALRFPCDCAIWNNKARKALLNLGFAKDIPVKKYQITANELARFNDICRAIAEELSLNSEEKTDLLGVDYFLYEVANHKSDNDFIQEQVKQASKNDYDHDEICEFIRNIGIFLGFEADLEKKIAEGARVDAIWSAQIGNLGVVNYVFEVQSKGAIDSLILNLQRAKSNPTVQKVVAVSNAAQLEKIRKETGGLPEEFKKALTFWEFNDVVVVYENLDQVQKIMGNLKLVNNRFPLPIE